MSDLGGQQPERAEPLVLPELFFDLDDLLVKPGVLDGDGGKVGEGAKDLDVLVRVPVGRVGIDIERADGPITGEHRHGKQ